MQVRTGNKPEQRSDLGPTQDLAVYTVHTDVERRVLTAEELAARVTASQALRAPRLPDYRPSAGMAVLRPASRPAQGVGTPAQPEAPEAPVAIKEEPTVSMITTIEPESPGLPDIPCRSCVHASVCRWEPDVAKAMYAVAELKVGSDPAIRIRATVECDHHAPAPHLQLVTGTATEPQSIRREYGGESWRTDKAPKGDLADPERAAASRQRGNAAMLAAKEAKGHRYPLPRDRAERNQVVLEAVRTTDKLAAAGVVLGVSETRVGQIIKEIRAAGQLPDDVAELLNSRNAAKVVTA